MPQDGKKKTHIPPSSAKARIASARIITPKPRPPATAPAQPKQPSVPIIPSLQMPSQFRPPLRIGSASTRDKKTAGETNKPDKGSLTQSVPSPAAKPIISLAPRLSLHAMTMALNMTRRVKQTVMKKRHERGLIDFEPTYRMEPHANQRFKEGKVQAAVDEILQHLLKDKKYEARSASKLACFVSNAVNAKIKEIKMPRYKLVCHVVIGDATAGDVEAVSRCLWNPQTDNFVSVDYSNGNIYGIATVYGVYLE